MLTPNAKLIGKWNENIHNIESECMLRNIFSDGINLIDVRGMVEETKLIARKV